LQRNERANIYYQLLKPINRRECKKIMGLKIRKMEIINKKNRPTTAST
jgi:hypothetical protein